MTRARAVILCALVALLVPGFAVAQKVISAPPNSPLTNVVSALTGVSVSTSTNAATTTGTTSTTPTPPTARLTNPEVLRIADKSQKVKDWIRDHPVTRTTPEFKTEGSDLGKHIVWYVRKKADGTEVTEAQVWVEDATGRITEVRVGPQVPWMMARGVKGAFGRAVTRPSIWITLSLLFLLPLVSVRRLWSWRTLDLLALLSFSASLVWFNRGEIFTSVPLAYPPMVYLLARMVWIALRRVRTTVPTADIDGAGTPLRPRFIGWAPTWVMTTALTIALGLRYGLNAFDSNVIDVGYAGVIGADRITHGMTPYGTFPSDCGRCDTYGPLGYITYIPFELIKPWSGKWDGLPAAHGAAVAFDVACVVGLLVLGWRLGGSRLAVALALAWAAFPFTAYALESNSNDSLVSAVLIWTLVGVAHPISRGLGIGLAIATKFSPAILVPLLWRSPFPRPRPFDRGRRGALLYVAGLALSAVLTGWVLLLDGDNGVRAFWSRTISYQFGRESPFSIWGQYPGLRPLQIAVTAAVALGALALVRWPRRRDLLVVSALGAAVLLGTQLTLTHWFYLYIPWFLPFVLVAVVPTWPRMVAPREEPLPAPAPGGPSPVLAAAAALEADAADGDASDGATA